MRLFRIVSYAFQRALSNLWRRPLIATLTIGVMTLALLFVGLAHLAERNIRSISEDSGAGMQMIVYLEEGASEEYAVKLSEALQALPAVEKLRYVSAEEALGRLRDSLGEEEELLEGVEATFVPASIEVRLMEGVRDLASAHPVIERLEATQGVEEVAFLGNWVDDLNLLVQRVQRGGVWLVSIAAIIGIFTVVATMRLSADSRASELRVLNMMGAPALLRRGPNLIEGALMGLFGAAVSIAFLYLVFQEGAPLVKAALASSVGDVELRFVTQQDLFQLSLFGISLGAIGGVLTNFSQARR